MRYRFRFRHSFLLGVAVLALLALYLTDPDGGRATFMLLLSIVSMVFAVGLVHLARKALFDYPEADGRHLFRRASEHPIGAGLALVAISIVIYGLLGLFGGAARAQDVRTYVPQAAHEHLPALRQEIRTYWPDHPMPAYFGALVEHESCITLRHSRCWNPRAQLKTAREEGAGLGQLTRAWAPDGRLRFDALAELRARHPALSDLTWRTVYLRPDLQLRALVLKSRGDWRQFAADLHWIERLAFTDAAYNGGLSGVQNERRACALKPGCDPARWFGHVEHVCLKSRAPLYGGRSACDINRHHVRDVLTVRIFKYSPLLEV